MRHHTTETYRIHEQPNGRYVVLAFNAAGKCQGGDFHWLSREAAEAALHNYQRGIAVHGKSSERQALGR